MKKFFWTFLVIAVVLSACVIPERDDPFQRLPEEEYETLTGEIFPFDVSVSTRATHRLEKNQKLVALLASDIVRLDDFVGREVELDGVFRTEKMREIFWVDVVRVQDVPQEIDEDALTRFETRTFSFVYPSTWEASTAPNGTVHFIDKTDEARRVFLTFKVEDITKEDKRSDPNVLIANLAGVKKTTSDELGRERQNISLFSNLSDSKYVFEFTSLFEEFDRKKAFFRLLNSFVEGAENVQKAKQADLKQKAEEEAEKLQAQKQAVQPEETSQSTETEKEIEEKTDEGGFFSRLFGSEKGEEVETDESEVEEVFQSEVVAEEPKNFTNLIDARAFPYTSEYYGFTMKSPWGFWFRNFGDNDTKLMRMGFANHEISTESDVQFWLEIVGDKRPTSKYIEKRTGPENNIVEIKWPRSGTSYFQLVGPEEFRDAMLSVQGTVKEITD
ncbi:MAG: hypothetical protein K9M51_02710 [Candidatus Gracilibacteria bacterium]|nr:hypothetical protein [Candidatus Gracilibacteria bacterium]